MKGNASDAEAVFNTVPANPILSIIMIENKNDFHKALQLSIRDTMISAAFFNLLLFTVLHLVSKNYISKKKSAGE